MSVELDPVELGFKRPFTHEVAQVLRLYNKNSDPVAFKVKTTAPKQYCVRPNSGRIEPGQDVEVQVLLQAMREDPPLDAKCRDKFLVQSVAISADKEYPNVSQIWSHIEQTAKSSIQEKKIRVVFLPAEGQAHSDAGGHMDDSIATFNSANFNSASPQPQTPQRGADVGAVGAISRPEERPIDNKHLGEIVQSTSNPATDRYTTYSDSSTTQSFMNSIPTSGEDVKAKLAEAQATIARMSQERDEQGLRQRKTDAVNQDSKERISAGTTGLGVQKAPAGGVPVQVVAGLCLLCFLIAYFFF
ncbi:VAMP-associated protein [Aureobasidium sp. EXF-3400]|nr:VAMP-associated protein [Aureobasidium sp. EXF-12344]KAI4770417.1 VAMP-associated protein [Aureobasidium sp. EXF-3400]